ncbi:MAG: YdcP family protein [Oscillospiraceae bacterium]|nr:YdcP family protein [Oscillospiraceae bacterium]
MSNRWSEVEFDAVAYYGTLSFAGYRGEATDTRKNWRTSRDETYVAYREYYLMSETQPDGPITVRLPIGAEIKTFDRRTPVVLENPRLKAKASRRGAEVVVIADNMFAAADTAKGGR